MSSFHLRLRDLPAFVRVRRNAARRRSLFAKPDLTYLFWESTLRCNLRCLHCGSSCEAQSPFRELETAEIRAILDTIAEDFDARRIFASVTGGEPLLRPDLVEVISHMTRLGMRSSIVTNGTLLGQREAASLVEAGVETTSVSVDGLESEHDAVRGRGTYRLAIGAIETARRAGVRVVEAITCVRQANLDSLVEIERRVRQAGAHVWRLVTVDKMGRLVGQQASRFWLAPPQIGRLFKFIEARRASQSRGMGFEVRYSCGGFLGVRREARLRPRHGGCYAGLSIASILCDGQVSACPSLPRSWAQGSALEARFSRIWHERFLGYRDLAWRRSGPCVECSWFDTCLGGGLHERLAQPEEFCWLDRQDE